MPAQTMDTSFRGIKHRVPPRNESRLLVRVNVIPQNGCDIGSQHVKHGEHDVIVYASELTDVMALVRTEKAKADFARAEQVFANQIADLVRNIPAGPEGDESRRHAMERYGESPYSIMAQDPSYRGGFGKLMSCVVIEEVAAPPTVENLQATQFGELGRVLSEALSSRGPTAAQITSMIEAEVTRRMADAEERLTRPRK